MMTRVRLPALLAAGLLCCQLPAAALEILLTNDDGFAAPGLAALGEALAAGGHRVTVVAPRSDQSGTSARITTTELRMVEERPGVFVVDGSPADAVWLGLHQVFAQAPPDIVVSGVNRGQNLGATSHLSGTVGAALMATLNGVPAVAVSAGLDFAEKDAGFPSTLAACQAAARLVARLLSRLEQTAAGGTLLPSGVLLNLNHPALGTGAAKAAQWAVPGREWGYAVRHVPGTAADTFKLEFGPDDGVYPPQAATDTARFAAGHPTVSLLAVAGVDPAAFADTLAARLAGLVED